MGATGFDRRNLDHDIKHMVNGGGTLNFCQKINADHNSGSKVTTMSSFATAGVAA